MAEGAVDWHIPRWLGLEPSSAQEFGSYEVADVRWMPTAEELNDICESHCEWLESGGQGGQKAGLSEAGLHDVDLTEADLSGADLSGADLRRADLPGADLSGADLSGTNLSGADLSWADLQKADLSGGFLSGADLSGTNLREADLSGARLRNADLSGAGLLAADLSGANLYVANLTDAELFGADLSGANLSGTDLMKVDFRGADLTEADLKSADLSGALLLGVDLTEADLRSVDLSGAFLQDADLSEAILNDADLTGVDGLQVGQLRGATTSLAILPDAIKGFAGLDTAEATTRSAKKLFISVLAACGYAALAIALKTGGSGNVVLPIIGLGMETQDFFLVTPGLLALLFGYFHLQMQRLWRELAQLPAIFPDGKPLDEKVHPWLITGLVQAHVKRLKERKSPPFFPLQRFVAVLLAWGAVPTTLGYFAWMYPLDSGAWGSFFLHTLAALTASGAYVAYRKAARTLQLRDHHPITFWKSETTDKKWILKSAGFRIGVALLIVAVSIWYVRFYGLPW